jgi:S1-C subfamily serine protease
MRVSTYTSAELPWYVRAPIWFLGCLAILAAGLIIGRLLTPVPAGAAASQLPPGDLPEAVEGQRRVNEALRQRASELEAAKKQLKDKHCGADASRAAREALGPESNDPSTGPNHADPQSPRPSSSDQSGQHDQPGQAGQPGQSGQAGQAGQAPGSDQSSAAGPNAPPALASATVLVLGEPKNGPGVGVGTGFFIDKTTVLTNGHVVDDLNPATLTVSSRPLNASLRAQLVTHVLEAGYHGRDYAILKVPDAAAIPHGVLALARPRAREAVIAAGFPGSVLQQFRKLGGDGLPPLYVQNGVVVDVVTKEGVDVVWHTAKIAKGDSGGPLVDACNRAIGLNTFLVPVTSKDEPEQVFYFAKAGGALTDFLQQAGIKVPVEDKECTPQHSSQ